MKSIPLVALLLHCAFAAEYLVGVGKDEVTGRKGVGFDPSVIRPAPGDVIAFEFRGGAHSAVQSTFDTPCIPLEGGYNSNVFNVDDSLPVDAPGLPSVRLTVNGTDPIWFFDQAGGRCRDGGVLAVNPSFSETATMFKANAARSPEVSSTADVPSSTAVGGSGSPAAPSSTSPSAPGSSSSASQTKGVNVAGLVAALAILAGL